jgi:hypothetical protein
MSTETLRSRIVVLFRSMPLLLAWARGRARGRAHVRTPRTNVTGILTIGVLGSDPSAAGLFGQCRPSGTGGSCPAGVARADGGA